MMSTMKLTSVDYYVNADERGDRIAYYEDPAGGLDGERQRWFVPPPHDGVVAGVPAFARDGAAVDADDLRTLAAGRHPATGRTLVERKAATGRKAMVGQDLTFSAPKSVSVLFAVGDAGVRTAIRAAQDAAVRRALSFLHAEGAITTRRGKRSARSEPAAHYALALFEHSTSRAHDPQVHTHCVLANACVRSDGTVGGVDNASILRHAGAAAAIYRTELASQLRTRLGVEAERAGRNFEIAGCPEATAAIFSKRRHAIEAAAEELGFDTSRNRKLAQIATLDSRTGKCRVSAEDLETSWSAQLLTAGFDRAAIAEAVRQASASVRTGRRDGFDPDMPDDEIRRLAVKAAAGAAVVAMSEHDAVVGRAAVLRQVVEGLQCIASADEALAAVEAVMASGELVAVGTDDDGRPVYSTPALIAAERDVLRHSDRTCAPLPAGIVEGLIAARPTMSDEQADAVRRACLSKNAVVLVEGAAGAGKSFSARTVADAYKAAAEAVGRKCDLHGLAPSWSAAGVLAEEAGIELARAVEGFLLRVEKGEIVLTKDAVIVVDEAGLLDVRTAARLLTAAARAQCRVIMQGDTRQLSPVGAGAPMRLLAARLGTARIETIRRQQVEWMKTASTDFSRGRGGAGILQYDDRGCIRWAEDRDAAMAALVADYVGRLASHPEETRLVVAGRNADVARLNAALRDVERSAGRIAGDDVVVRAVPRGRDAEPVELRLAVGDRIVFGERIEAAGQPTLNNSEFGRVTEVGGDPTDPTLVILLDKGGEWRGRFGQLVGKANSGDGTSKAPKIQHAYACTVYQAQGKTVDSCLVYNVAPSGGRGLSAEAAYVGMTRHRHHATMYVASDALLDRLPDDDTPLQDPVAEAARTRASLRQQLAADSERSDGKANVSDFVASVDEFQRTGDPRAMPTPAQAIRTHLERRRENPMAAPTRQAYRTAEQLAAERDAFARVDLADHLCRHHGFTVKTERAGRWTLVRGDGKDKTTERLSILRRYDGTYVYTSENGKLHGRIWDWPEMCHRGTDDFRRACDTLRGLGYGRDDGVPWSPPPKVSGRPDGPNRVEELSDAERTAVFRLGAEWAGRLKAGWSARLEKARALSRACLHAFAEHIRTDQHGNDCFAHRAGDGTGRVVGWEVKGGRGKDGRNWTSFSPGGRRWLFRGGDTESPRRIVVCETAIDSMSYADAHGLPGRTLYLSTAGNTTADNLREIRGIARRHPGVEWRLACDHDEAGSRYRDDLRREIAAADPAADIKDDLPPSGKDWSEWHADITWLREPLSPYPLGAADLDRPLPSPTPMRSPEPEVCPDMVARLARLDASEAAASGLAARPEWSP